MSRILFIFPRKMATTEGVYELFTSEVAHRHGLECRFSNERKVNSGLLKWADAIVLVRNLDYLAQLELIKAKKRGLFCIQFFDDDVLGLPPSATNRVQYLPWRKRAVENGFASTDLILSPNRLLAEKYAEKIPSKRSVSINTAVDPDDLISPEERASYSNREEVRLVYAAGANHEELFDKYIEPAIPTLIKKYKDKISFTFFGVHPDLSKYRGQLRTKYYDPMPLDEYRKAIRDGHYDIGLSPLISNDFTQYKYFNKYIEYTLAGIVGIYSKTQPYTQIIEDGSNGFVAENNDEAWLEALCRAIENSDVRERCYKNAYSQLSEQMTADNIIGKLLADIPELAVTDQKDKAVAVAGIRTRFLLVRTVEDIYLVSVYLKEQGVKGTIRKVESYIKDRLAARKEKLGNE